MRQELTQEQMEDVAELTVYPGFKLLLEAVQSEIDATAQDMMEDTHGADVKLLPYWKALNRIFFILKINPEKIKEELESYRRVVLDETMQDFISKMPSYQMLGQMKKYIQEQNKREENNI